MNRAARPLRTGRLGTRRRVEHARLLYVARLKRRRERRHGIPAVTAVVVRIRIDLSGLNAAFAGLGRAMAATAAAAGRLLAGIRIAPPQPKIAAPSLPIRPAIRRPSLGTGGVWSALVAEMEREVAFTPIIPSAVTSADTSNGDPPT